MNKFVISIIALLKILPFICSESLVSLNPDLVEVFSDSTLINLTFTITGYNSNQNYIPFCNFSGPATGFANAIITPGLITSPSLVVTLNDFTVGRNREFVCNITYSNSFITVTKYLSVRPVIQAYICGNISAVNVSTISFLVRFSASLDVDSTVSCSSSFSNSFSQSALKGSSSLKVDLDNVNIAILPSTDTISCSFTRSSQSFPFSSTVIFNKMAIAFQPNVITTYSPIVKLNLVSNYNTPVGVNCTIVYTSTSTLTCPAISNPSINWSLSSNQITFSSSINAIQINMTRTGPIPNFTENYTVVCCVTGDSSTAINAVIQIYNNAIETNVTTNGTETQYGDLRFIQLASCPCDLTANICDQNCCCDPFCSCTSNTTPITGPYGGYFNDPLPRSCSYQDELTRQPYQSLLCTVNESPNILGDYYPMQNIINDVNTFSNVLSSSTRSSGIQIKIKDLSSSSQVVSMFIPINSNFLYSLVPSKYLYLPRQVLDSSKCDLQNPIVLLQPFDSTCSFTVTNSNCESSDNPRLSSYFYLSSSTITNSFCSANLSISSVQGNIPVFAFYKCVDGVTSSNCNWDNGYRFPPAPSINSSNCDSVVSSVAYTIYYNTRVLYIKADIILQNVSLNTNLDQRFVVSFVSTSATNVSTQAVNSLESFSSSATSNISGRYGYDNGMPILTVSDTNNLTFVNMKTFSINPSGTCTTTGNKVLFLQDSLVQCTFTFSSSNCFDRRKAVKDYLDGMFPNNAVAVYGNPSSSSDFIVMNVDTLNITNTTYYPYTSNITDSLLKTIPINAMPEYCVNFPTGITMKIYYARQGKARNQYINNIVSVVKSYQLSNVSNFLPIGANASSTASVTLTAYFEFSLVSANIPGSQSTNDNVQGVCLFDICLNELFYPWMYNYEGKQGFYEESFGLFLLGLAIFLLVTTYPWW